ncbi:unnamed protein product [Danaus chrysippus]|uniref:(African queen) hypothetical protein n=1 Tax=Danaus chrysippus TaxID=151541 RepID=A0A8J2VUT2_9NEOP|nr:unnamed protein product [Danaus chrysippus]
MLASVLAEDVKDRESLLVQINSGLVRGYKDPQKDIFVFNGIPYATAPTDSLRLDPKVMRSCILFCSLLVFVLSQDTKARESRLVHIDSGLVRGYKDTHDDVFVFYGIPYATAPTGSERFQVKKF